MFAGSIFSAASSSACASCRFCERRNAMRELVCALASFGAAATFSLRFVDRHRAASRNMNCPLYRASFAISHARYCAS